MTNDDGIDSDGLHHLARAMTAHGDVHRRWPRMRMLGGRPPLGVLNQIQPEVHQTAMEGVEDVWAVTGPPGLCVMFASLGVFGHSFDIVVAGINPGANFGRAVFHSGTVGAALTARGAV